MDGGHEPDCVFCEISHADALLRHEVQNTVIVESGDLLLIPALGPLMVGHALVVPRRHTLGRLTESVSQQTEHMEFIERLRESLAHFGRSLFEVEHGMGRAEALGPCISHTHTHVLPTSEVTVGDFSNSLPERLDGSSGSYLWVSDGKASATLEAAELPGQGTRRLISAKLGISDWDWAVAPKLDAVSETIAFWRSAL